MLPSLLCSHWSKTFCSASLSAHCHPHRLPFKGPNRIQSEGQSERRLRRHGPFKFLWCPGISGAALLCGLASSCRSTPSAVFLVGWIYKEESSILLVLEYNGQISPPSSTEAFHKYNSFFIPDDWIDDDTLLGSFFFGDEVRRQLIDFFLNFLSKYLNKLAFPAKICDRELQNIMHRVCPNGQ